MEKSAEVLMEKSAEVEKALGLGCWCVFELWAGGRMIARRNQAAFRTCVRRWLLNWHLLAWTQSC